MQKELGTVPKADITIKDHLSPASDLLLLDSPHSQAFHNILKQ